MRRGQENALLAGTVALSAALVGPQAWSLWQRLTETAGPVAAAAPGAPEAVADGAPDLQAIMAFAPFGKPEDGAAVDAPAGEPASPGLMLRGITLAGSPATSRAIIAAPGGPAQSFAQGDPLPSGAVLVSVAADHVVLRAGESETVLAFPTARTGAPPAPTAARTVAGTGGPDLMNLIPGQAASAAPPVAPLLTGIRLALGQDPAGYVAGLGLVADGGGYRVGDLPDAGLTQAGLRPGDLVLSVNGLPPGSPDRDLAILDAAAAAGTAVIEVTRAGQGLTLTVPLP